MKLKNLYLVVVAALLASCGRQLLVTVQNPSDLKREKETVAVSWSAIQAKYPSATPAGITITTPHGEVTPHQLVAGDSSNADLLIFQVDVAPNSQATYTIRKQAVPQFTPAVFGRTVPERMDDFAWENNRIAFRVYGPALEATGEISNGIDVWVKRTDSLIINKWYKSADYHTDHGEGLDCYKVGRTLGAGAMAPWVDGKLWLGNNYTSAKVLANGPIRVSVLLTYKPFDVNGEQVQESRLVTLDANSNLSCIRELYSDNMIGKQVVAGIVSRDGGEVKGDDALGWLAYWEPVNGSNGNTALAVVIPRSDVRELTQQGHYLCTATYTKPFCYYAGASWSKAGFSSQAEWFAYVDAFAKKLKLPLVVKVR
jgi:hypothetical protein